MLIRLVLIALATMVSACDFVWERDSKLHREQLELLLKQKASVKEVDQAARIEPTIVVTPSDASKLAGMWTNPRNSPAEVREKVGRWPQTRVYMKSSVVWFVYFDAAGVMRDYSLLSN